MQTQNVPAKKSFRVDELAKELGVKKFIIKNWEKQFDIKKCGLDNKYSQEDFKIFATIKNLVLIKKIPQSIAKKHLQEILAGKEITEFKQEPTEQMEQESNISSQATREEFDQITRQPVESQFATQETATQEPAAQEASARETAAQEVATQEASTQDVIVPEPAMQELATPNVDNQDIFEIICKQEQQIEATSTEDIAVKELVRSIIEKELTSETETTFQGAHEDIQNENSETMLPEENPAQEILAAQAVEDTTDIKPAFKEKEAFMKNIQSFKEQLLKIHNQLK